MEGSITTIEPFWYQCECCAKFLKLAEPLADDVQAFTVCNCQQGAYRRWAADPDCRHCGGKLASTTDDCDCPDAVQERQQDAADAAEREEIRRKDAEERQERQERQERRDAERAAPAIDTSGLAVLRREAAREQQIAARERAREEGWQDVLDSRLALAQEDIAERKRASDADGQTVGLTFADFGQEVTLLDVDRLPSAFVRADGETLLYEGLANTIYGEPSTGKSWIALMAVIQNLRAGRRVIWWDNEDRATTLARRLQILRTTNFIGVEDLAWRTGDLLESPTAMIEALEFLDGGNGPGLVVIDSATSFGCPKDGADIQPWVRAHIKPWITAGHTSLLLDHVPKQRKDRPAGGVGSFEKLSDIRGAALYAHGTAWNGQEGGAVHLTIHKDAHGQLPAPKFSAVATITAEWDGPTLDWTVGLPNAKPEGEDLQSELLDALEGAGAEGVKGSRALRELLKGKRAKDIDAAREELLQAGMIERVKDGRGYVYTISR